MLGISLKEQRKRLKFLFARLRLPMVKIVEECSCVTVKVICLEVHQLVVVRHKRFGRLNDIENFTFRRSLKSGTFRMRDAQSLHR